VLVHAVYDSIADRCAAAVFPQWNDMLFYLVVSSLQLDADERGFSYSRDAPLDMRMDASEPITAARILRDYDEARLRGIFERYGEEKLAGRYARAIVARRVEEPIERSGDLVRVLEDATPAAARRTGHVAKRVFQALRIEVNQELRALERAIPAAMAMLPIGGRILVLSYHSLEDRIVKRAFSAASVGTAPAGLPVEPEEHAPRFRLLVRGAEQASEAERSANPRAASVRLRAAERVRAAA
jgi:16S rRNA (cytosine1402-N4)-methyltransferase